MLRFLKAVPLALPFMLALTALGFLFTSCTTGNSASARFVHAIANTGELDIEINGTKSFPGVVFDEPSSGYIGVPAGSDTIEGFQAGTTTQVFDVSNVSVNAGSQYTLIAAGPTTNDVTILNPVDINTEPADGTVNFRVINASFDGPSAVYVYIVLNPVSGNGCQGTATVSGLAYQQVSGYVPLQYNPSGGYTVYVCNAENGNPIFSGDDIGSVGGSSEGSIRTLILTDNSSGTGMSSTPVVLNDLN